MEVTLLSITENPEKLIEEAGRTCYDSSDKITNESSSKFIKMLINSGHESVLEHASATFIISGVSRALTHQLVRHRLASYSQRSQRYVKENNFDYVIPPSFKFVKGLDKNDKQIFKLKGIDSPRQPAILHYSDLMFKISELYQALIEAGIPKEDARFILPNACCTEIVMTANFREWRHILKERMGCRAQWEIKEMSKKIINILHHYAPNVFEDLLISKRG